MGDKGMIIEIDKSVRESFACCDVSWISKFPDECEVLIARSAYYQHNFCVSILSEENGMQIVSLKSKQRYF